VNLHEHQAKALLAEYGVPIPRGKVAFSVDEAVADASELGLPVVVKAQIHAGGRGKAGGVRLARTEDEVRAAADAILGVTLVTKQTGPEGRLVRRLLVEEGVAIARELYVSFIIDRSTGRPMCIASAAGGMDIEEVAAAKPDRVRRAPIDIRRGIDLASARSMLAGFGPEIDEGVVAAALVALYRAYRENDAELLEVNPLARLEDGRLVALDCKFVLDDSGAGRREALVSEGSPEPVTALEARAAALGLKYIELDGDIGVLANGAGLTMTTMDVITRHGGRPANFLEIGGEAYTKATPALELVLDNPRVKCLLVNFCGAFARTDVMTGGVIDAWEALAPSVPVFFSVHGTGSAEARAMLRERLGVTPCETMDEAVAAAVSAARETGRNAHGGTDGDNVEDGGGSVDGNAGRSTGGAP
jgi:succinyl-CoA synthetase beta subunit